MTQIKNMPHSVGAFLKGVGVDSVELNTNNHLIVHLDNGQTVDAGEFKVDDELDAESTRPLANKTLSSLFSAVNERINTLVGGNATEAIDNLNEIIAFLEGFKDSETLASTLAEINNAIAEVENDLQIKWRDKGYEYEAMRFTEAGEYDVPSGVNNTPYPYIATEGKVYKLEGKISLSGGTYVEKVNNKLVISGGFFAPIYYITKAKPILDILIPSNILRKDDVLGDIIEGSTLPVQSDAIAKELQKKVDKVDGKGLSTNDFSDSEKEQVAKIEGKQDALTLTVKDNGNIVLGNIAGQKKEFMPATPSGDPMHYYYLSHYGVTYNESTGFFELEYLKDLTANDMRNAVRVSGDTRWLYNEASSVNALVDAADRPRTNIAMRSGDIKVLDKNNNPRWERALEQWIIGKCSTSSFATLTDIYDGNVGVKFTLVGLAELRYIVGVIDISTLASRRLPVVLGDLTLKLQEVRLAKMKTSQTIIHQKNLSKDSISYLLSNRINTEEISLSLPAELYNKIMTEGGEWADLRSLCEATTDKGKVILELNA